MSLHTTLPSRRAVIATAITGLLAASGVSATTNAATAAPVVHVAQAAPQAVTTTGTGPAGSKLQPQGCALSGTTANCDLYAMAGSTQILGNPVPIWGFSTTGDAGSATAPGPLLVVPQGTQVTITLHNQLAQDVALALPGQVSVGHPGGVGDDLTGVGTSGTRQYTFTANRAGTFVYEAGHTPNGNREVAMGLAGALVVLPADGTAYGAAAGMPDTGYLDEGVLVLSEIDPDFNAAPLTFDLRNFTPAYRLINGKPFPASDPINTDQGHTVLLRYVNVGAQMHAMSVLGANQVEIAQDAHPMKYTTTVAAESIDPGATLDTLVQMPGGPETKLAVYENALHLDNAGQSTGDPEQLAFGGMMTFLDTHAPAPSTDDVGPTSKHVTVSPNPSDGKNDVTVTADLSDATTGGSTVTQAEFVVDDAVSTGVGFGIPMTGAFGAGTVTGVTGVLPVGGSGEGCTTAVTLYCLPAGKHTIFVRAADEHGNWGVVGSAIFNLPKTGPQTTNGSVTDSPADGTQDVAISATGDDSDAGGTITDAEYFVDTAGADGTGTALTVNRQAAVVSEDVTMAAADVHALGEGTHHILVHSKDSLGLWGPTLDIPFVVDLTGPNVDAATVGPNPTNGLISDAGNDGFLVVSAQITDKDAGGQLQSTLKDAEAFLDPGTTTPEGGTGLQLIAVDGAMDSTSEAVYGLIPLSEVHSLTDGTHHVFVRGQDAAGNWGPMFGADLVVDKSAPALGALAAPASAPAATAITATAPVTDASIIASAEYWFGTTSPAAGHGNAVPVSVVKGKIVATVPVTGVAGGANRLNLRVKDLAGNWSRVTSTVITVVRPNPIFSSTFESGTFRDWSATSGPVRNLATARVRTGNEARSAHGLQVGGHSATYLIDNRPSAENTYHARFAFDRHTLTTGTDNPRPVTVFEGRTATGQAFAVQLQVKGKQAQLRTVLARSGAGALVGRWVNLAAGPHTIRVDWVAAAAGSLALRVNGTVVQVLRGNTSTLRVESARLGVTSTPSNTSKGVAYIDTFVSTRNTL